MREEVQTERVCSAFDAKKRAGEFNVKNAPFGYKLSGDKNKPYLIDEPAAKIVREIFALKKAGESIHGIMRMMDEKYPMPRQYLYEQGLVKKVKENPHWNMSAVSHILTYPAYLGHMICGKTVARLYRGIKKQIVPKDQWEIIENVNEEIIARETFDAVQSLLKEEADKALALRGNGKKSENIFKGMLRCQECGMALYRAKTAITPTNIVHYFGCPRYRDHKERGCSHRQTIREKLLKSVVLTFIKAQVKLADELEVRVESINENALRMKKAVSLRNETVALQERIEKLEFYLRSSFESHISGVLNESDYLFNKSKYVTEILSCKNRMESLAGIVLPIDVEEVKLNPYVTSMRKFSKARALTREMCVALIEKIEVDKDNVVTIFPKYRDEFSALCEGIEKEESKMKQNE